MTTTEQYLHQVPTYPEVLELFRQLLPSREPNSETAGILFVVGWIVMMVNWMHYLNTDSPESPTS